MEIENFNNYLIYPDGRVFSKKRNIFLKPIENTEGYYYVNLYNKNGIKYKLLHRLLGKYYIPNPNNLPCINHKDGNRKNNNLDNLEWCDVMYNSQSINKKTNFGCVWEDKRKNKKYCASVIVNKKKYFKLFYERDDAKDWLKFLEVCVRNNIDLE